MTAARRRRHQRREQLRRAPDAGARDAAVAYYEAELARARTTEERRLLLADLFDEGATAGVDRGRREVNAGLAQKLDAQREAFALAQRSAVHRGQRILELESEVKRSAAELVRKSEALARLQRDGGAAA